MIPNIYSFLLFPRIKEPIKIGKKIVYIVRNRHGNCIIDKIPLKLFHIGLDIGSVKNKVRSETIRLNNVILDNLILFIFAYIIPKTGSNPYQGFRYSILKRNFGEYNAPY